MIYHLEKLNFRQIDSLPRDKTVFFIPISPIEEHGPHLPVGVDAFNAEFFSSSSAEKLNQLKPEWHIVIHPLIPVGTQVFKHIGSIYIKQRIIRDLVAGVASALAIYDFRHFIVFSFHGGPRHMVALEEASKRVSKKYGVRMIPLTGALAEKFLTGGFIPDFERELGRKFSDEERRYLKNDLHAGWWETSMMLRNHPDKVQGEYEALEPVLVPYDQLRHKSAMVAAKGLGYFGAPHQASVEFAEASIRALDKIGLDIITRFLDGEDVSSEITSRFYKMLIFRTDFKRNLTIVIAICAMTILLLLIL